MAASAPAEPSRPNDIVIYTDDQGYRDAGCSNPQSKIPAPNFDRLAEQGMRFTDGHSSDTVCTRVGARMVIEGR